MIKGRCEGDYSFWYCVVVEGFYFVCYYVIGIEKVEGRIVFFFFKCIDFINFIGIKFFSEDVEV